MTDALPIDEHLDAIVALVRSHRRLVLVAPPGAGKTTRVPAALTVDGPVLVLQPRRVAARSLARRIASERGWSLGNEVGWQVRSERRFGPSTRLLVATEGILTARLVADPLLSGFTTVVLDEFHERSVHADLGLALVREAAAARPELRIVVMSATFDPDPVAAYLAGAPVIRVEGRPHDVAIRHAPGTPARQAIVEAFAAGSGHLLAFLAGAPEIRRLAVELRPHLPPEAAIFPLHGSLDAAAQDAALAASPGRKVILATNLAETSITVEGVTDVVDSGLQKVLRYDPASGLDRLETERISEASAVQRAGRAGRTGPGRATRLWDPRDHLRDRREPEIARIDLAGPFLQVTAWGGDPLRFPWLEPPQADRAEAAMELLRALGAVEAGRVTALGRRMARLPLHPRLARLLIAAGGGREAAAACAILSNRWRPEAVDTTSPSDLLAASDRIAEAPPSVRREAEELAALARGSAAGGTEPLLRAIFDAYPDRLARRREPGAPSLLFASGRGGMLARESSVRDAEFLVAVDVAASGLADKPDALVRAASAVDPGWIVPTARAIEHALDAASGTVRAREVRRVGAIVLESRPAEVDPAAAEAILAAALAERGLSEEDEAVVRRLRFAGLPFDLAAAIRSACAGRRTLPELDLPRRLPRSVARDLDRLAPETLPLPSGRSARLEYRDDGSVAAAVKLQELFGLAETPRVGARGEPVLLLLLAPNGRPVQTTRDLRSFWDRTYPEVRRELRGRYPRHPWPDDPWSAPPTHRAKRRRED